MARRPEGASWHLRALLMLLIVCFEVDLVAADGISEVVMLSDGTTKAWVPAGVELEDIGMATEERHPWARDAPAPIGDAVALIGVSTSADPVDAKQAKEQNTLSTAVNMTAAAGAGSGVRRCEC